VYRTIIDDVIASVTPDFDEYGLDEEVLQTLQAVRSLPSSLLCFS
jgi:transcription initiation factor TFIIA large subunit